MPFKDPEMMRAHRRREVIRLRARRAARRAGLIPRLRTSVVDPDDYGHPDSDASLAESSSRNH